MREKQAKYRAKCRAIELGCEPIQKKNAERKLSDYYVSKVEINDTVYHAIFGQGSVKHIECTDNNIKAVIKFEIAGEKTLLLSFAKLKLVL